MWSILMQDWLDCCSTTIVNSLQAGIVGLPNVGKVRATHSQPASLADSHDVDSLASMLTPGCQHQGCPFSTTDTQ